MEHEHTGLEYTDFEMIALQHGSNKCQGTIRFETESQSSIMVYWFMDHKNGLHTSITSDAQYKLYRYSQSDIDTNDRVAIKNACVNILAGV